MHHLGKIRSLWSSIAFTLLVALPATAADIARYILPPGNYGGLPFTANSTDQLPLYSGLTPLRDNVTRADINQVLPARGLPADRRRRTRRHRPARPAADLRLLRHPAHLRPDPRRRRLRRRLGDRPRPRPAAPARPRSGARRRRRRPEHRRLLAGDQRPVVRAERRRPRRWSRQQASSCVHDLRRRRAGRSSPTRRPTPTASTPTAVDRQHPAARHRQRRRSR